LADTKRFLAESKLRGNAWREQLRQTLGVQDIEVFGVDPRTHVGRVLVEADYRMKLVGMGLEPSIPEVASYLDRVELNPDGSAPPLDVARWWFTLNYDDVVADDQRQTFEFTGSGVKVLSETEFINEQGKRLHTGQSHGPTRDFARDFTRHFDLMADHYPVYRQLKNVFDLAIVSALIRHQGLADQAHWHLTFFGETPAYRELTFRPRVSDVPRTVESVMNHRVLTSRKNSTTLRHTIVGVSGGVSFDAMEVASHDKIKIDPSGELDRQSQSAAPQSDASHWWWD
jgi:hypothetical protein